MAVFCRYSPSYGKPSKPCLKRTSRQFCSDLGSKAELGMLALQLGTEETTYERPFTLNLYGDDENMNLKKEINQDERENDNEDDEVTEKRHCNVNKEYKTRLENLYADLEDDSTGIKKSMDLLELLDEV